MTSLFRLLNKQIASEIKASAISGVMRKTRPVRSSISCECQTNSNLSHPNIRRTHNAPKPTAFKKVCPRQNSATRIQWKMTGINLALTMGGIRSVQRALLDHQIRRGYLRYASVLRNSSSPDQILPRHRRCSDCREYQAIDLQYAGWTDVAYRSSYYTARNARYGRSSPCAMAMVTNHSTTPSCSVFLATLKDTGPLNFKWKIQIEIRRSNRSSAIAQLSR